MGRRRGVLEGGLATLRERVSVPRFSSCELVHEDRRRQAVVVQVVSKKFGDSSKFKLALFLHSPGEV